MKKVHFMVEIRYYKLNSIQTAMLFKILYDMADYTLLDPRNKI